MKAILFLLWFLHLAVILAACFVLVHLTAYDTMVLQLVVLFGSPLLLVALVYLHVRTLERPRPWLALIGFCFGLALNTGITFELMSRWYASFPI